ncbi:MAG: DUF2207 domain-containing protein, partial [Thermoleophilia bacterium]|nr:DUF2207 domain-containing protein [Thermoleophilia bacterium]
MSRRRLARHIGLVLLLGFVVLACGLLYAPSGQALAKEWRIDNMDVSLAVQENGDVMVDETVTFAFTGNFHFVARSIPTDNMDGMSDISVRDVNGNPLPRGDTPGSWDTFTEDGRRIIQVNFDLTDASATWTFHYRAKGVVMFFDQGDELRWYVFDAETPVSVERVRTTVKLPGAVPPDRMTQAVQTGYGIPTSVTSPGPSTMVYEASNIPPYTNFWIVTGFPKGVVKFTWNARRVAAFLVPKVGFLLPIAAFLVMLLLWRRR